MPVDEQKFAAARLTADASAASLSTSNVSIRFGLFEVDLSNEVLRKDGVKLRLPHQSFQILSTLLRHPGSVVTREALRQELWPTGVFVDFDRSLNTAVQKLRRALRDSSRTPRYIETLPRHGYRFIAQVEQSTPQLILTSPAQIDSNFDIDARKTETGSSAIIGSPSADVRNRWFYSALLGIAMVLSFGMLSPLSWRQEPGLNDPPPSLRGAAMTLTPLKRRSIAVFGFKNVSGERQASWLSTAFSEMLSTELASGDHMHSVAEEEVARAKLELSLKDRDSYAADTLAGIHKSLECDYVIDGSYLTLGHGIEDRLRLDARVQDALTGETVASVAVVGSQSNLFELAARAGQELRAQMGVENVPSLDTSEEMRAAIPSDPKAARLYTEGLENLRTFNTLAALDHLEAVTKLQPNYAPAYAALASTWSALGYDLKAVAAAENAMNFSRQMPKRIRLESQARFFEMQGSWDRVAAIYADLHKDFPDTLDYWLALAKAQSNLGNNTQAMSTMAALRKLNWPERDAATIDLEQAAIAKDTSDWKEEEYFAEQAEQKALKSGAPLLVARAKLLAGWAFAMRGEAPGARDAYELARKIFSFYGDFDHSAVALMDSGLLAYRQGDLAQAKKLLVSARQVFQRLGDQTHLTVTLANLASIYNDNGDLATAEHLNRKCLNIFSETGHRTEESGVTYNLGETLQEEGKFREAAELLQPTIEQLRKSGQKGILGYTLGLLGVIREEEGDMNAALDLLQKAVNLLVETGDKLSAADTEQYLARFESRHGDIAHAKEMLAHALAVDKEVGAKGAVAFNEVLAAEIEVEQGETADAAGLRAAAEQLGQAGMLTNEIEAELLLSRVLLGEGNVVKAVDAVVSANLLARKSHDPIVRFETALSEARLAVARKQVESGDKILRQALRQADEISCVRCKLQAELESGKLECERGHPRQGRALLQNLADDAARRGFGLIANSSATEGANCLRSKARPAM